MKGRLGEEKRKGKGLRLDALGKNYCHIKLKNNCDH